MDSKFNFNDKEEKIYEKWEKSGAFECKKDANKKPFVVVMPPPNITGKLHMGHALDNTLQDIFIRYNRLKGVPTLWVPGTDHASIATEVKVVKKIAEEGKTKQSLGRNGFLKEAWEWKEKYGSEITRQLRKIGSSCDWKRERFTLDDGCSKAVLHVFKELYDKGLIYKGKRLINWCPNCKTAIADMEVEYEEQDSYLWHIKYPIENSDKYLVVATTRPETMLGDTAVAVNPKDDRYKDLVGKRVYLPIVGKYIEIVADRYVEMEFGTGVVKITPAHDKNDYEVGKRHNLEIINILNEDATINENGGEYEGQDRFEARKNIVARLKEEGYLVKEEKYTHNVGTCYRCHSSIEPYYSNQWFVKMEDMARPAIDAVKSGKIKFVPKRFEKQFFNWMENIEDWCISRQLWWGHRIPAYTCEKCGKLLVSETKIEKCECGGRLIQDEDTLDTWFSSALWPFSVFGWPDETEDFKYFYPTTTLVTGYDIIPFWVSKMIFSGIAYTGKIPFENVYIHGLVRDSQGRKMSKSLGNGIDPLEVIEKYGADALRFSLVLGISAGNDLRFSEEKLEAARNFSNKLWNAARFVNSYVEKVEKLEEPNKFMVEDKWILTKLSEIVENVTKNIENHDVGVALENLYTFIWQDFCDWYIEMVKPRLYDETSESHSSAIWTLNYTLKAAITLLHPYMPYVTEEIYENLKHEDGMLINALIPQPLYKYEKEKENVEKIRELIKSIRNVRSEMNIVNSKKIDLVANFEDELLRKDFENCQNFICKLALVGKITIAENIDESLKNYYTLHLDKINVFLDLSSCIDKKEEIAKLQKEKENLMKEVKRSEGMLNNENFISKAPEKLVNAEREKLEKYSQMLKKVEARIDEINN